MMPNKDAGWADLSAQPASRKELLQLNIKWFSRERQILNLGEGKMEINMRNEKGAVEIVEAAVVFPVTIFIVVIFIFLGNLFYQQAKVDAIAVRASEYMARMYSHPILQAGGAIPTDTTQIDVQPYRYLFGSSNAESMAQSFINRELGNAGTGLFSGMDIHGTVTKCEIENYVVYHKTTIEIQYTVNLLPLKLFGGVSIIKNSCATSSCASDPAEFIRNIDMIMDYSEQFGLTAKIKDKVGMFMGNR